MSRPSRESGVAFESSLQEALAAVRQCAAGMGAGSAAAFLWEDRGTIRGVYCWPASGRFQDGPADCANQLRASLETAPPFVSADNPAAQLLSAVCGLPGASFLLSPWRLGGVSVMIAFGFAASVPARASVPADVAAVLYLAALAIWGLHENRRLHSQLEVVAARLGKRKLVERAKGLLQVECGFDEPQAYAYLRRLSRQRRLCMADIAEDLLTRSAVGLSEAAR